MLCNVSFTLPLQAEVRFMSVNLKKSITSKTFRNVAFLWKSMKQPTMRKFYTGLYFKKVCGVCEISLVWITAVTSPLLDFWLW